jgi:DNA-binding response OmpR family regulator
MSPTGSLTHPRILLADDDKDFLKALGLILKNSGFEVTSVTSGDHAILAHEVSLVARKPFDILVLDLRMPGASGWEVLRHVREHTPDGDEPPRVLLMTGFTVALDLNRVKTAGADGILIKPFVLTALVKEIRRILSIRDGARRESRPARKQA